MSEWAHRYINGGETGAEIAATYSVSPTTVLQALAEAGIERRPAMVRTAVVSDDDVIECYVGERLSLRDTARRLGVSIPRVRAIVARHGVLRAGFDPSIVDRGRFAQLYARGATVAELADAFDITPHHASVAIRSFELPARQPHAHKQLLISDRQLAALVDAGHSDVDIAARHHVAVWAVVQRRRRSGLRRPINPSPPPLSRARLERQLAAGKSRADIATTYHVGLATVTRWCAHYGIDVVGPARPSGGRGVELDPQLLRRLYIRDAVVDETDRRPPRCRLQPDHVRTALSPHPCAPWRQQRPG